MNSDYLRFSVCIQDSLAEWSKALASGASPKGRGFEPHSRHSFLLLRNDKIAGGRVCETFGHVAPCGALLQRLNCRNAFVVSVLADNETVQARSSLARDKDLKPPVGMEPTTIRLRSACSAN